MKNPEVTLKPGLIDWITTIPFLVVFIFFQLLFDVLIKLCWWKSGRFTLQLRLEQWSLAALRMTGTRCVWNGLEHIPVTGPCLIISNHQSLFDIPLIEIPTHRINVHFISKKELARWIPATSVSLRVNGHYLIDRQRGLESRRVVAEAAKDCGRDNSALVLFPEGTRARDGVMKAMKSGGFQSFIEACPTAKILPVTIHNSWKITAFKLLPVPFGTTVTVTFHVPFETTEEDVFTKVEAAIRQG